MIEIKGIISSGLKEAGLFMQKDVYVNQYSDKLGFMPYFGTLNIKVDENIDDKIDLIKDKMEIIEGNDEVGSVYFVKAQIINPSNNMIKDGAILFPTITIYSYETLEFISDEKIRDSLNVGDNDRIIIKIE